MHEYALHGPLSLKMQAAALTWLVQAASTSTSGFQERRCGPSILVARMTTGRSF
ncbi:unnamed protein product [Symbiodinium pilosum]|uniref:Uncharacterized protein n=1 Tax=Symbiodinium pilosum TaxID=2952 RepID=A0A812K3X1_SYMPI|nr:unnamed protein product [Symbiodinium pilosum]